MDGYRQTSEEYDSLRYNEDDSLREPPKGKPKIKVVSWKKTFFFADYFTKWSRIMLDNNLL